MGALPQQRWQVPGRSHQLLTCLSAFLFCPLIVVFCPFYVVTPMTVMGLPMARGSTMATVL